jgi:hypothetical protein
MAIDRTKINQIYQSSQQFNQEAKKILGMPTPVQSQPTLPPPIPQLQTQPVQPTTYKSSFAEVPSLGQRIMDVLNFPSAKTEEILTGGRGYEKVFNEQPGLLTKSTATRIVADPLNLLSFLKPAQILGKLGKVSKFAGVSERLAPTVQKIKQFISPVAGKFIRGYGLPEEYNVAKKMIPRQLAGKMEQTISEITPIAKTLLPKERSIVAKTLEAMPMVKGQAVKGDLAKLAAEGGERFETVIKPAAQKFQEMFKRELDDLVTRGRLDPADATALLNKGGYYPHMDFATETVKKFLTSGVRERRTYLKVRKGAQGYSLDAPVVIAKREARQHYDNVVQDFLKFAKEKFGQQIGKGQGVPEGMTPFLEKTPGALRELKGWALPDNVAKDIIGEFSPTGKWLQNFDKVTKAWKFTATQANPAFHVMNIMGNLWNSWLGGMKNPARILQSIRGGFSPEELNMVKKSGILNRGAFAEKAAEEALTDVSALERKGVLRNVLNLFTGIENNARGAFFLDQRGKLIAKGIAPAEAERKAIELTNKYLFDYVTGLTPFEANVMRRLFPFYTWARFNIPLQFQEILKQPYKFAFTQKAFTAAGGGTDEQGLYLKTPIKTSEGKEVVWRPNLPVQDIFNLGPKRALSMLHPAKNIPAVGLTASNILTGSEFEFPTFGFSGVEAPISSPYLPRSVQAEKLAGFGVKQLRPLRSVTRLLETPETGVPNIIAGGFTTTQTPIEKAMQKSGVLRKRQEAIRSEVRKINRNPNLSPQQKQEKTNILLRSMTE